jgi:hypothetical protein
VKVLPEELTVHLRSYGRVATSNGRYRAVRTTVLHGRAGKRAGPTRVNPEQASKDRRRECRPSYRKGKAAVPGASTVAGRATRRGSGEGTYAENARATRETHTGVEVAAPQRLERRRPVGESEGPIIPGKPGNAGGGKGPCFWDASEEGEKRRLA